MNVLSIKKYYYCISKALSTVRTAFSVAAFKLRGHCHRVCGASVKLINGMSKVPNRER